ncbi:MAG: hypothetical protein ABIS01_16190, partial [Ferruginibacter sp.]
MKKMLLSFLASFCLFVPMAFAQWDGNPITVDNPVSTSPQSESGIFSVTDGSGGAIVMWIGNDQSGNYVNAQHKSSTGQVLWGTNVATPKQLFSSANEIEINDLVNDGAGGAYVSWSESITDSTTDVFIQHVNNSGTALFTAGGLRLNPVNGQDNNTARLISDAAGVIVAWDVQSPDSTFTLTSTAQIIVQRFNAQGVAQWTAGGVQLCTAAGQRAFPCILSDGGNGAFIGFVDARNSGVDVNNEPNNIDIYAQHLSSSGARLWGTGGVIVTNQLYNQVLTGFSNNKSIISDRNGGFIVAYNDYRNNNNDLLKAPLYAQRINSSGARVWAAPGVAISTSATFSVFFTGMVSDGVNGAVIGWNEASFQTKTGNEY